MYVISNHSYPSSKPITRVIQRIIASSSSSSSSSPSSSLLLKSKRFSLHLSYASSLLLRRVLLPRHISCIAKCIEIDSETNLEILLYPANEYAQGPRTQLNGIQRRINGNKKSYESRTNNNLNSFYTSSYIAVNISDSGTNTIKMNTAECSLFRSAETLTIVN